MAKKVTAQVKLQIPAGKATPAPPVGTALGPQGVNIMEFCKAFNAKTSAKDQEGLIIPVVITIFSDRSFTFITKTPPVPVLIKRAVAIAKGSAEPHATVRLYLNQADVAQARTQADGRWSLTIKQGMTPGAYVMRAEEVGSSDANVVASAETPFDYPDTAASTSPTAPIAASTSPAQSSPSSPADPVIESVQTKRVATGHTLWALSKSYYGDPTHYPVIYDANRAQIHNPNVIFPGQVFVVPKSDAKP